MRYTGHVSLVLLLSFSYFVSLVSSNPLQLVTRSNPKFNLIPTEFYARCGTVNFDPEELDLAAKKACEWAITGSQCLGLNRCSARGSFYSGTLFPKYRDHSLIQWRMRNKFKPLKAKVYTVVDWNPEQRGCKALGVYWVIKTNIHDTCVLDIDRDQLDRSPDWSSTRAAPSSPDWSFSRAASSSPDWSSSRAAPSSPDWSSSRAASSSPDWSSSRSAPSSPNRDFPRAPPSSPHWGLPPWSYSDQGSLPTPARFSLSD